MVKEDKITGTMKFIKEQLRALRQNRVNGTFTVRLGLKDGGICTTGITVDHKHVNGIPNLVQYISPGGETKKN